MQPFVSVIITAYNRKKFLLDAVKSVLDQNIARENFEIVVVKNFNESDIDNFLKSNNIKSFISYERNVGHTLALGIQNSIGEVCSFLDDDDLFEPQKLAKIMEVFSDSDVIYYHNEFTKINADGKEIYRNPSTKVKKKTIVKLSEQTTLHKIMKKTQVRRSLPLFFNTSSISIRRSVFSENKENSRKSTYGYLKKLYIAQDNFFFYSSCKEYGKKIVIDSEPLTKYRSHVSTSNVSEHDIEKKCDLLLNYLQAYTLLSEMMADTSYAEILNFEMIFLKIEFAICKSDREFILKHLLVYSLACYNLTYNFIFTVVFVIEKLSYVISRRLHVYILRIMNLVML
ncbi:MAG: glycosyltransferase family 2 protein [Thermoplasmatales archaeon]